MPDLDDFAYELPAELIAQHPVAERDQSRLLYYNRQTKNITHHLFSDLSNILHSGDVLVVNNTQVIPAKLSGRRVSGGLIEFLLLKPEPKKPGVWQAMATNIRKLKIGEVITVTGKSARHELKIEDIFTAGDGQRRLLVRLGSGDERDNSFAILKDIGSAPLPPYIVQAREKQPDLTDQAQIDRQLSEDLERYQTVFAKEPGAVAAPTAGLHFSNNLLDSLVKKGIAVEQVTLHVGPGTFKPITSTIEEHTIEPEWYAISQETCGRLNQAKKDGRRIIAVGTTSCRTLEGACINGELQPTDGSYTSLYIRPGYQFRFIDGLLTNFHLSKSSLLLLVAALIGRDELMRAYHLAIAEKYRFYSYGDAMVIL